MDAISEYGLIQRLPENLRQELAAFNSVSVLVDSISFYMRWEQETQSGITIICRISWSVGSWKRVSSFFFFFRWVCLNRRYSASYLGKGLLWWGQRGTLTWNRVEQLKISPENSQDTEKKFRSKSSLFLFKLNSQVKNAILYSVCELWVISVKHEYPFVMSVARGAMPPGKTF